MILQLNPPIPMSCPKGKGQAIALIDYSSEHNLIWVIAIDDTAEIWSYQNHEVRMQNNITMGRIHKKPEEAVMVAREDVKKCDASGCDNFVLKHKIYCDQCFNAIVTNEVKRAR